MSVYFRPVSLKSVAMDAYDYELPVSAIAEFPLAERDDSRLLVVQSDCPVSHQFIQLGSLLPPLALMVFNNSRVIEARLQFLKPTGGTIEVFCLRPLPPLSMEQAMAASQSVCWLTLVGGASKWKPGQVLQKVVNVQGTAVTLKADFTGKEDDQFVITFTWTGTPSFGEVLAAAGCIPLPPYIKRTANSADAERYQTVFATSKGSVAAPTAALHFTPAVFQSLENKGIGMAYVTLHVGAGTFKPVKTADISAHQMHTESFIVTRELIRQLQSASLLVAVGTTSLRTLESLYWIGVKIQSGNDDLALGQWEAYELNHGGITYIESLEIISAFMDRKQLSSLPCETRLLIIPGYRFRSAQALITNFHQPRSTLLLLVAAFIGDTWKQVYDYALKNKYRFLSYGDSSLLWRKT